MNRIVFILLLLATFSASHAQQPTAAWPAILLAKPLHIGDDTNKEMRNPRPDAPKFSAKFDLPPNVKPGVAAIAYVTIEIGGLVPDNSKGASASIKTTKLFINGTEIAILNKLIRGADSPKNIKKLPIRIPRNCSSSGSNELEIIPGATTNTIDDFELHRVIVGSSPQ